MSKNRLKPALCCLLSATVFATSFSGLPLVTKTASAAEASATTEDVNEADGTVFMTGVVTPDEKGILWKYDIVDVGGTKYATNMYVSGTVSDSTVEIPSTIDEYEVISIGTGTSSNTVVPKTGVTTVIIPASVRSIKDYAFQGCNVLELLQFNTNSKCKNIGKYAFNSCTKLQYLKFPSKLESIGDYAFQSCTNLTNVTISSNLKSIGICSFESDNKLANLIINGSVENIGSYAFQNCSALTSLNLPEGTKNIKSNAFYQCSLLSTVKLPDGLESIGNNAFYQCSKLSSVSIPGSVEIVGDNAFKYCSSLTNLTLGNGVSILGNSAFQTTGITSVNIPGSVKNIGSSCFQSTRLTEVYIPKSVTRVGRCAFGNSTLTKAHCDANVGYNWVFDGCSNLKTVIFGSGVQRLSAGTFGATSVASRVLYFLNPSTEIYVDLKYDGSFNNNSSDYVYYDYFGNSSSKATVYTYLGREKGSASNDCGYPKDFNTSYGIVENITEDTEIPSCKSSTVLQYDTNGGTSTVPASVEDIDPSTVYKADSDIWKPTAEKPGYTFIGWNTDKYAHAGLKYLHMAEDKVLYAIYKKNTSATTGDVNEADGTVFMTGVVTPDEKGVLWKYDIVDVGGTKYATNMYVSGTVSDSTVEIPSTIDEYEVISIGTGTSSNTVVPKTGVTTVIIPASVRSIKDYAFQGCNVLELLQFNTNSKCKNIGKYAFKNCSKLQYLKFPSKLESVGDYAFQSCTNLTNVTISSNLKSIGIHSFESDNKLANLIINGSVENIGSYAFQNCSALTSLNLPEGTKNIKSNAFYQCSLLSTVKLPDGLESIGNYAFYQCSKLSSVSIPGSVEIVGDNAFRYCSSLTNLTLGNGVSILGNSAFHSTGITSVNIPGSVKNIGSSCFQSTRLTEVYIPKSVIRVGKFAFSTGTLTKAHCDANVDYYYVFDGCSNLKTVIFGSGVQRLSTDTFGTMSVASRVLYFLNPNTEITSVSRFNSYTSRYMGYYDYFGNSSSKATVYTYLGREKGSASENFVYPKDFNTSYGIVENITEDTEIPSCKSSAVLQYDTNGGSSTAPASVEDIEPGTVYSADSDIWKPTAERAGYTFVGWNTDRNAHEGLSTLTVEEDTTLYAIFKKDVTVSFKGTDSVTSTLYNKETTAEVTLPELPAKSGWTPVGWTTGETWEANAIVGTTTTVTENTQFYGLYKKNVTIKVNGEDTQLTVLVNNKDESTQRCKYTLPTAPTKPNYDFDGWKLAGSDSLLEAGAEVELDGTKDVVAQFTPYGYWVTFDANGGTGTMERQKVTFDETTALKANEFEREGYTFAGWTHGSIEYSDKQSVTNLASDRGEEYKLTAKWNPIHYSVVFNANGGTGDMTSQSVEYDSDYSLNRCSFTKRGYNFVGWSTNRESTTADYNDEQTNVNLTSRNGETVTLYAIWSTKSYTVTLDSNTATDHGTAGVAVNFNSKLPDITIPTKEARVTLDSNGGDTVSIDPVSLTFAGYFKGSTKYYDSEGKGIVYTDDEDCTLTAKFSKKTVTLPEPTKRGWTFKGWAESSNASSGVMDYDVTGDVTLYATWAKEKHNVVYDATTNGGTTTASTVRLDFEERIDLTKTATKSGWEFVGWNTDANATVGLTSLDMDVHDVKLYAIFKRVAKAVFKDCDGERTVSLDSFSGDSVSVDAPVARTNGSWVFRGWATDTTNTASPVNRVNAVAGGIVYYAVYEKDVALTCASENNTKRVEGKCYTNAADMSRVKPFTTTTLTAATAGTKEDWVLYGWGDGSDYLKKYDAGGAISITENTTIHGLYRRSVTLTFNTQGHVIPSKTVECLYNGDTTKAAQFTLGTPIREGYTFTTWELDGNMYSTGDTLTLTSNSTINANWIANTYSIHFDPNGGAGDMLDQQLVYGTESALNSNEFRKVFNLEFDANGGKCSESDKQLASEFVGWTCNGETYADRATVKNLTKVNDATVTLKAKWKPITTELPEPTKAGYVFKGWYDGERNVKGSYDVTKDTKLKAVWEVQTTKVALKLDATDCSDYSIEVVTGEDMPRLKNFNKQYRVTLDYGDAKSKEVKIVEYTLNGLYSEPNGKGTKFYNSSGNSCHEWDDTCNTLYAHWTENSITLQDVDLTGYTFNGWYEGSSKVNRNYTPTKDVVLKAQLAAAKYRITWDLDGGTLSYAPTEYEYNKVVTLATPVKTGYTFSGWYLNGRRVTTIERGTSGDVRLTASWTKTTAAPSPTPVITSKPTVTATATPRPTPVTTPVPTLAPNTEKVPDGYYKNNTEVKEVVVPTEVTTIGKDTFAGCDNLTKVTLPEGLESIDSGAFKDCTKLTQVDIPAEVTEISNEAFSGCTSLTSVDLPDGLQSIGNNAFKGCTSLQSVTVDSPSCDIWDEKGVFPQNTVIKGYYPSTASAYAEKYGYRFESLGNAYIMTLNTGNTAQVESYYIAGNKLLPAKVNVPIYVASSGIRFRGYALDTTTDRKQAGSEGIKTLVYDEKGNLVYKVPFDLNKDISLSAVWEVYKVQSNESAYLKTGTKFTKGKLKYVVTGKGKVAVYGCTKTTSVSIPTSVTQKGKSYKITEVKAKAFKNNKTIKSITIGKNVVKIGSEAFRGCKNLGKISVKGKSLKSVGKNAAKDTKKRLKLVADRTVIKRYKKYFKQAGSNTLVI